MWHIYECIQYTYTYECIHYYSHCSGGSRVTTQGRLYANKLLRIAGAVVAASVRVGVCVYMSVS